MEVFERLEHVLRRAEDEQELPDYLSEMAQKIIENSENYSDCLYKISELADLLEEYDTYAQTGYIGMGVDSNVMERALRELLKR